MSTNIYYKQIIPVSSIEENTNYNYVYQITEISSGKKYIGSRGSKIKPDIDVRSYKSSSTDKDFILRQNMNPTDYNYEILSYHKTRTDALVEESRLHNLFNVGTNPKYFNKSIQCINGFTTSGMVTVKDHNNNTLSVSVDDDRYIAGELQPIAAGTTTVKDTAGNTFRIDKNDPRIRSGELVGVATGTTVVRDSSGNCIRVNKNDPRVLSGLYQHPNVGKVTVKNSSGHTIQVDSNDPRFLSGELKHITRGKTVVKDASGNILHVDVDDPRIRSGELVGVATGTTVVRDSSGNCIRVNKNDPRILSGELVHITKGMFSAKDINGNIVHIGNDDPRYISGEIIHVRSFWYMIDGTVYNVNQAIDKFGVKKETINKRCKSNDPLWKEWNIKK